MNKLDSSIYEHEASPEDRDRILKACLYLHKRLYHTKTKKGYLCRCLKCGREYEVNEQIFGEMLASRKCFKCANNVKIVRRQRKDTASIRNWIAINNEEGCMNGYEAIWRTIDGEPTLLSCRHVLHSTGCATWVRSIIKNMGYSLSISDDKWQYWRKPRSTGYSYDSFFTCVEDVERDARQTRRDFYEQPMLIGKLHQLKSNQQTFIKNGIFDENQILYIQLFDLNYPEDVLKYTQFMQTHHCPDIDDMKFSVHVLDYLVRTNNSPYIYRDYVLACRQLGIKPQKPANLTNAEAELDEQIELIKQEEYKASIRDRHEELSDQEYSKGEYCIKVFTDIDEMHKVAKALHNCIAHYYVAPYATRKTDVYYGTQSDKVTFALEVNNQQLVQLRTFNNRECDDGIKKFVADWCKRKQVAYDRLGV